LLINVYVNKSLNSVKLQSVWTFWSVRILGE